MSRVFRRILAVAVVAAAILLVLFALVFPRSRRVQVPVLMYHHLAEICPEGQEGMTASTATFRAHMEALKAAGYESVTPRQMADYVQYGTALPKKPILITFDDGYIDNYTNAMPILKKYGMRATVFVVPGFTGVQANYLNWEQLKEMEKNGFTIQSHTLNHRALEELPDDEIRAELLNSKVLILFDIRKKNSGKHIKKE